MQTLFFYPIKTIIQILLVEIEKILNYNMVHGNIRIYEKFFFHILTSIVKIILGNGIIT